MLNAMLEAPSLLKSHFRALETEAQRAEVAKLSLLGKVVGLGSRKMHRILPGVEEEDIQTQDKSLSGGQKSRQRK